MTDGQTSLTVGDDLLVETGVSARVCTADVRRGLERRYGDGWLVLHEVANHLGHLPSSDSLLAREGRTTKRYLDTLAVGMYRSLGYQLLGHEIKVSRADWLAEKRNPQKAGAFSGLVSGFYIVAPKDVVRPDELPEGYGLLLYYSSRIRQAVQATELTPTIPLSWVAALLARAVNPKRVEVTP